jgi:hypothetical protein
MGFAEFARGMSAEELDYHKKREETRLLKEHHSEVEDLFTILRPAGENLPALETRFSIWTQTGIS